MISKGCISVRVRGDDWVLVCCMICNIRMSWVCVWRFGYCWFSGQWVGLWESVPGLGSCNIDVTNAKYTPPMRLNCRVESRRPCVHNPQLVGDSLDESEQICQKRSRVASCRRRKRTGQPSWPSLQFLCYWAEVGDKWRHNDVIVEKSINQPISAFVQRKIDS